MTGEWSTWPGPQPQRKPATPSTATNGGVPVMLRLDSDPVSVGVLRARMAHGIEHADPRAGPAPARPGDLRPARRCDDAAGAGTGQRRAADAVAGARRAATHRRSAAPMSYSRFNAAIAGRAPKPRGFDLDISSSRTCGSWCATRVRTRRNECNPVWVDAVLVDADGRGNAARRRSRRTSRATVRVTRTRPALHATWRRPVRAPVLRLDGQVVRAVARRGRRRQPAHRDRLDAQSGGAVLHLRRRAGSATACCRRSGRCPCPPRPRRTTRRRSWTASSGRPSAARRRPAERTLADAGRRPTRRVPAGSRRRASPTCCGPC